MISRKSLIVVLFFIQFSAAYSQHHKAEENTTASPLSFSHVMSQALSDSALTSYKMVSSVMTIRPGAVDTVSHRHDCELFGYVLEGDVQVALVTKEPKTFSAGQMFYEKRNILHTITRNPSSQTPARVLLIFIIKDGRNGYTPAYNR
jgi:quercetin dioxygenase-like cupin family protein